MSDFVQGNGERLRGRTLEIADTQFSSGDGGGGGGRGGRLVLRGKRKGDVDVIFHRPERKKGRINVGFGEG